MSHAFFVMILGETMGSVNRNSQTVNV